MPFVLHMPTGLSIRHSRPGAASCPLRRRGLPLCWPKARHRAEKGLREPKEDCMFCRELCGALVGAVLVSAPAAHAQTFPTRNIIAISPFSAGNAVDITGRVVLDQMARQVGQPFVIENRPG